MEVSARPIRSIEQLAKLVTQLGLRLQRKADRTARSKARITKLKKQLADERARLIALNAKDDALNMRDSAKIWVFDEGHPELRHGQNVELGSGTGSHRSQREGALQFEVDEQTTIDEIRSRFSEEFDSVVETKYFIRKNPLKREFRWLLDRLTTASAPSQETFTIYPLVTEEFFRASVQRFRSAAITLELIPDPDADGSTENATP